MSNLGNGLFTSRDVFRNADGDSNLFVKKYPGDTIIANHIICDDIDINGGLLTTSAGGTVLELNGVPVGGVNTVSGTAPINVTAGANPVVSLNNSGVVAGVYPVADVTVNAKGLITNIVAGTIPPNDDWSNFPAQTNVDMNNFRISSLATPTVATDASTKGYVDSNFVTLTTSESVGGVKTFTSLPESAVVPTTNTQLTNKLYVDTAVAGAGSGTYLPLAGGTMTGASATLNMNTADITNIGSITAGGVSESATFGSSGFPMSNHNVYATNVSLNSYNPISAMNLVAVGGVNITAPNEDVNINCGDFNVTSTDLTSIMNINQAGAIQIGAGLGMNLSAGATISITTPGQIDIGSGNVLGATTSIEGWNFKDNEAYKLSSGADLTISDVASISNTGTGASGQMAIQTGTSLDITTPILSVNGIANTVTGNVLYYDSSSKAVTYGTAPGGGGITTVDAGSNITVDNTTPTAPIVSLSNPLTDTVAAGENQIGGSSTAGTLTSSWSNEANFGGTSALNLLNHYDTNPTAEKDISVLSQVSDTLGGVTLSYNDITNGPTLVTAMKVSSTEAEISAGYEDIANSITVTRSDIVDIDTVTDIHSASNATINASRVEITGYTSGVTEKLEILEPLAGTNNNQQRSVQLTGVSDSKQFQNLTTGVTSVVTADNTCDLTISRYRLGYSSTGGAATINNTESMYVSTLGSYLNQSYVNSVGGTKTTTLQTISNGTTLATSDTFLINAISGTSTGSFQSNGIVLTSATESFNTTNNAGAGAPTHFFNNSNISVASHITFKTYNSGHNATGTNDFIYQQLHSGKNGAGGQVNFAGIDITARAVGANLEKGVMAFNTLINGTLTKILELNTVDGTGGKITASQPIDIQSNAIKSSNGNIALDTSASSGTGNLNIILKSVSGGINVIGSVIFPSAGGSSGQHLRLIINGTPYKIALLNDT